MASWLELHEKFCTLLESRNVYFNTPESFKMNYDCIRYDKSSPNIKRANDKVYLSKNRYDGVIITKTPDSDIPNRLLNEFSMCNLGDMYVVNNLNHFPFTLYY